MASIPASAIVSATGSVISAGGTGIDLVGLILTANPQIPVGDPLAFSSATAVGSYFGLSSAEYSVAQVYFAGFINKTQTPGILRFARYATADAAGYLRGASVASLTLAQLQALSGTLSITVGGVVKTSSAINLSAATSFSSAATIIQAAFTSPGFTVSYDAISGGFLFTTTATGASATMTYATGTLADGLNLTQTDGAVLSQGVAAYVPATAMANIIASQTDWVLFTTMWAATTADQTAFAAWSSSTGNRFGFLPWTSATAATLNGDATTIGPIVKANAYEGTAPIFDPNNPLLLAAFVMGWAASLNTSATNGRYNAAFRRSSTLSAGVTNQTISENLIANGYNFLGSYATASQDFVFFYPGQMSGSFSWIDSWICQVWLNNQSQLALLNMLLAIGQVPYNPDGYGFIKSTLQSVAEMGLNFGAIRNQVTLSEAQIAEVTNLVGQDISDTLYQRGWYIYVADPGAAVRAARGSPIVYFIYTDGGSVQKINLSSVMVQ